MQGEFAIIMPRIRGRARGQFAPIAQSPCGVVLLDATVGAMPALPTLRELCDEIELYARAASITTLRVALAAQRGTTPGTSPGATPSPQGRGAAEILAAISTLRSAGIERIAIICVAPPTPSIIRTLHRSSAERTRGREWETLPDSVRVVVGLAAAIGSVAQVTRGVAAISTGPVASPEACDTRDAHQQARAEMRALAEPEPARAIPDGMLERDATAQIARLVLTLPEGGVDPPSRIRMVELLYAWLTEVLQARPTRPMRPTRPTHHMGRMRPTRRLARPYTWPEALEWLDAKWDNIVMHLALRDRERAELLWTLMDLRFAEEGGFARGANVRAAPFLQHHLDQAARDAWLHAYGNVCRLLEVPQIPPELFPRTPPGMRRLNFYGILAEDSPEDTPDDTSGDTPDDTPPPRPRHAAS